MYELGENVFLSLITCWDYNFTVSRIEIYICITNEGKKIIEEIFKIVNFCTLQDLSFLLLKINQF